MIQPGTKLAHYEIVSALGKGGMGEVWRARDTKLGREVAVKVLPSEFAQNPERLARLEREARVLAALNHPNIGAIHGLERTDDTGFLVLELVEGDTLADRLKRGAIPVQESLKIARQIAEALEAAHEKGVVHRDLKPANVKITPEGRVKVLDFGLAKASEGTADNVNLSNSPTLSMEATRAGLILGTAAYMSPEQAKGQATDSQTDVWAFGCLLFELVSGRPAFDAPDVAETLAAVIRGEPNWSVLPANLDPRIRKMLGRCIEKDRRARYRHIGDVGLEIDFVLDNSSPDELPATSGSSRLSRRALIGWGLGTAGVAGITGVAVWTAKPNASGGIVQFEHRLESEPTLRLGSDTSMRMVDVTSDGNLIVYSAWDGLRLRRLGSVTEERIPGTEDVIGGPTFAPDDRWIAYIAGPLTDSTLKYVGVDGGPIQTIAPTPSVGALSWDGEDHILRGTPGRVDRVSISRRETVQTFSGDAMVGVQRLSNDDILVSGEAGIFVYTPETDTSQPVWSRPVEFARYLPQTGHLVFLEDGTLNTAPFDLDSLTVGQPQPRDSGIAPLQVAVSEAGSLITIPSVSREAAFGTRPLNSRRVARLSWVDRQGSPDRLPYGPARYSHPKVSPDGSQLAVQVTNDDGRSEIRIGSIDGSSPLRPIGGGGNNSWPLWADEGRRLIFASDREGPQRIYWMPADLTDTAQPLTPFEPDSVHEPNSWSPAGVLSFTKNPAGGRRSIWTVTVDADFIPQEPEPFVGGSEEADTQGSAFSPNGDWLIYRKMNRVEDRRDNLFLKPYPPTDTEIPVTTEGGSNPIWSGDEVFYRRGVDQLFVNDQQTPQLIAKTITFDPAPDPGPETPLPVEGFELFGGGEYDFDPKSDRFIAVFAEEDDIRIQVTLNWIDELTGNVG